MNKSDMNLVKENSDHLQWQDYFVFIAMLLISCKMDSIIGKN